MQALTALHRYIVQLPKGKIVLWCYLIWYVVTVILHFDPSPAIWLNSVGLSLVIGIALKLSVAGAKPAQPARPEHWQNMRLFLMPFCVSSFASLIKGKGYVLIAPPDLFELAVSIASCVAFVLIVMAFKRMARTAIQA